MSRVATAVVALVLLFIGAPLVLAIALGMFAARPPSEPKPPTRTKYRGYLRE